MTVAHHIIEAHATYECGDPECIAEVMIELHRLNPETLDITVSPEDPEYRKAA